MHFFSLARAQRSFRSFLFAGVPQGDTAVAAGGALQKLSLSAAETRVKKVSAKDENLVLG